MKKRKPLILSLVPVYASLALIQIVFPSPSFLFDASILSLPVWCTVLQYCGVLRNSRLIPVLALSLSAFTVLTGRILLTCCSLNKQMLIESIGLVNIIFASVPLLITARFTIKFLGKEHTSINRAVTEKCLKRGVLFMLLAISLNIFACHLPQWLNFTVFILLVLLLLLLSTSIKSTPYRNAETDEKSATTGHGNGSHTVSETHVYRRKKEPLQSVDNREYIIREVEKYFLEDGMHLNPRINEEMIASRVGTNVSYLSRAFNSHLKMSFKEFLHYHRIREACMMILSNPQIPNNEISSKCGYNVVCTFNNHFKRWTGKTPMEFKKEILISNKDGKKQSRCIDDYLLFNIGYDENEESEENDEK